MRNKIVFVAAHLGYPMDKTPLGGGAMVGVHLSQILGAPNPDFDFVCLGSGPEPPSAQVLYAALKPPLFPGEHISLLSAFRYARFSRWFEKKSTNWILDRDCEFTPQNTCILVNDISESPDIAALSRRGYPILSLWHVDVVDYVNRLYLKEIIPGHWITSAYEKLRALQARRFVPDILKLIFEKEREIVMGSRRLIFPSQAMKEKLASLYPNLMPAQELSAKGVVLPWGTWSETIESRLVQEEVKKISEKYQLSKNNHVLLTVSRISPEKGLDILLKAVQILEKKRPDLARQIRLFICGEPAFMQGRSYAEKISRLAQKLKLARVFFPGYLSPPRKKAFFEISDLFISPSIHESYGLTIVEAMAGGCPILAGDHYGAKDLISPEFGRIAPYRGSYTPQASIAFHLEALLADKEELKKMRTHSQQAASKMRFENAAQKIADLALGEIAESKRNEEKSEISI